MSVAMVDDSSDSSTESFYPYSFRSRRYIQVVPPKRKSLTVTETRLYFIDSRGEVFKFTGHDVSDVYKIVNKRSLGRYKPNNSWNIAEYHLVIAGDVSFISFEVPINIIDVNSGMTITNDIGWGRELFTWEDAIIKFGFQTPIRSVESIIRLEFPITAKRLDCIALSSLC